MRISIQQFGKPERAMTLVEVLIAAGLAAIILTSLYLGIATNFSILNTTRQNLRATQVMISKLEEVRLCAWSTNQLFNSSIVLPKFTDNFYPDGLNNTTNLGVTYYGTITISTNASAFQATFGTNKVAPLYLGGLAVVTVTLHWTNGFVLKVGHTRSMSTVVAQNGIQNYVSQF
ncbi:MAG TPA: hypothetical protein VFV81_01645 [Verrucomicrobiae bacterium]|nr:hypothetical protein [Verrucomicrobiae bacterium]